jgi:hypothetical protein
MVMIRTFSSYCTDVTRNSMTIIKRSKLWKSWSDIKFSLIRLSITTYLNMDLKFSNKYHNSKPLNKTNMKIRITALTSKWVSPEEPIEIEFDLNSKEDKPFIEGLGLNRKVLLKQSRENDTFSCNKEWVEKAIEHLLGFKHEPRNEIHMAFLQQTLELMDEDGYCETIFKQIANLK